MCADAVFDRTRVVSVPTREIDVAQVTSGFRRLLSSARLYQSLQDFVGKHNRQHFVDTYVQPGTDDVLLDVGCGTGEVADYLPAETKYVGVDLSSKYIEHAKSRRGDRGTFICSSLSEMDMQSLGSPTIMLASGLLHHLEDEEVTQLFQDANRVMAHGARLITIDPCLLEQTHPLARLLIRMDRGQNVRTPSDYRGLADRVFHHVEQVVRRDLFRVPYDHAILTCHATTNVVNP